ncbi:MAG: phage tail protein [Acidimicrobiales bacterium]
MSQPFVGEIRMFGGNFAPSGWAFCNGQTIAISQNSTLFNLIGTTYGGNGSTTFNLPDLRGRRGVHQGTGSGLSTYVIGESGGVETVTLTVNELASHDHSATAVAESGTVSAPSGNSFAQWADDPFAPASTGSPAVLSTAAMSSIGGNEPHENRSPYLVVSYIISLFGIYPSEA